MACVKQETCLWRKIVKNYSISIGETTWGASKGETTLGASKALFLRTQRRHLLSQICAVIFRYYFYFKKQQIQSEKCNKEKFCICCCELKRINSVAAHPKLWFLSALVISFHITVWRLVDTMCPRSSEPFYIVSYYIKWVTTSWTHSRCSNVPSYAGFCISERQADDRRRKQLLICLKNPWKRWISILSFF